jgi:hypothetical protein
MPPLSDIALRAGFVVAGLVLWFWSQRMIGQKPAMASGAIGDELHEWTAPLLHWLHAHPGAANLTLIVTSALVDVFGLFLLGSTIFGPSVQPFLAILLVFALRQICQMTITLPPPPGIIWRHPGFPSLLVTYGVSNDFFFSGHTAISVLGALALAESGPPWLMALGAVVAALEALTVIVLRAHYTMDVMAAIFAAWGAHEAAQRIAPFVDEWLWRLL